MALIESSMEVRVYLARDQVPSAMIYSYLSKLDIALERENAFIGLGIYSFDHVLRFQWLYVLLAIMFLSCHRRLNEAIDQRMTDEANR